MAIKRSSKINSSFSMASMTDIVFLLLIFFLITTTLINPNALDILLPKSTNQASTKSNATITIKDLGNNNYEYYIGRKPVAFSEIELLLQQQLKDQETPTLELYANPTVIVDEVVKIMNIAKNNQYKVLLATDPE
ncbi:MAG: biopolymer transporter ExbD [Prevotellaceae bacterium]|jgi:biopolymer transport protein ExbD|nr:biopolymer transporter ExbD [Prevotellaceae bacterium]